MNFPKLLTKKTTLKLVVSVAWLKAAIHVLLDMMDVPVWTQFLAATYLLDAHTNTQNSTCGSFLATASDGVTCDTPQLLQFVFWERILYVDHTNTMPESKEYSGYFVGCSTNVGDSSTYIVSTMYTLNKW